LLQNNPAGIVLFRYLDGLTDQQVPGFFAVGDNPSGHGVWNGDQGILREGRPEPIQRQHPDDPPGFIDREGMEIESIMPFQDIAPLVALPGDRIGVPVDERFPFWLFLSR
jgi:hypothetical protein